MVTMTHTSFKKFTAHFMALAIGLPLFFACSKEEQVTLKPSDISGNIYIRAGTQVDSDTNDPNSSRTSNNTPETAQSLPNPTELGGFVSQPGASTAGPLFGGGDSDDYFSVYLLAGHIVAFNNFGGDLSWSLREPNTTNFNPVTGSQFTASSDGVHLINVHANSGASNYSLKLGATITGAALNTTAEADFVPGEVILRYKDANQALTSRSLADHLISSTNNLGFEIRAGHPSRDMLLSIVDPANRASVRGTLNIKARRSLKQETLDVIEALKKQPDVAEARPNYIFQSFAVPNDPGYKYMWDYQMMKMEAAWTIEKGDTNPVIVAVLDTGVLSQHEDLAGKLVTGYDFIKDPKRAGDNETDFPGTGSDIDSNPQDPGDNPPNSSFHGTHVSGTVAAATDNGVGIPSVGWNIKVMPLRVLGVGGGTEYDIEQAILYAIDEPNDSGKRPAKRADVINMSLGGPVRSISVPRAFQLAFQKNVFIVAAAGNDSPSTPIPFTAFPAGVPGVISVGAVGSAKTVAAYSNYGSFLSLVAPGGDTTGADLNNDGRADWILSTLGSDSSGTLQLGYGFEIGTSMASPHVAAAIGLMKSIYPGLTLSEFQNWLTAGVLTEDLPPLGRDDHTGYGLLDAEKALNVAYSAANVTVASPKLALKPTSLAFSANTNSLSFQIVNEGDATLIVTDVSANQTWATIEAVNVDNNRVGEYRINIDRSGLALLQYNGLISVASNAGNGTIPFTVQPPPPIDNAGAQYVRLSNLSDPRIVYTVRATYLNGVYGFAFNNVQPGTYKLGSFSNLDNNDATDCTGGESCGLYIATSDSSNFISISSDKPISGIKFYTGFNSVTSNSPFSFKAKFVEFLD